jgi:phosphocarrier protein HPr
MLPSDLCTAASAFCTMPSASREIIVSNKLGLHARPAMQFVDLANSFKSDITVQKFGEEPGEADGKSVMQMIILAATEGTKMRIDASGEDAEEAVAKLAQLFEDKFGEGE